MSFDQALHLTLKSWTLVRGHWSWWTWPTCRFRGLLGIGHDDVRKWKHFPRYWTYVRGIHRSPVNSPHRGQWRGTLMCSLVCAWINGWGNNREAADLRRQQAHYDVFELVAAWATKCFVAWEIWKLFHKCIFQIHFMYRYIEHFMWN